MSEEMQPKVDTGEAMEAAAPLDSAVYEAEQNAAYEENQSQRQVPLDALESERSKRQKLEDELSMMRDNMNLLMAQQSQKSSQSQDEFQGLGDDDVLTVGEFKKAISQREQQYRMSLDELRMTQKHPDYQEVITKYLPDVLKSNPSLRNSLQQTQDYELAYYLAKNSEGYKSQHKQAKKSADAQRIVENAQRAGSLSSVGKNSPISEAKRWSQMSDADFMKAANKNLGYF